MSSRRKPSRRGESRGEPSYSGPWSEWTWSEDFKLFTRYRSSNAGTAVNGLEWDYKKADEAVAAEPRTIATPTFSPPTNNTYPEETGAGNYTTERSLSHTFQQPAAFYHATTSSSSRVDGITDGIRALNTGSYSNPRIRGDPSRPYERFDKIYKLHKEYDFKQFRVFKVIWSEPQGGHNDGSQGSHDTISVRDTRHGPTHEKVRRFVIISPMRGHCLCLPINTYLKQGVLKHGVHAEHHTVIHTARRPEYLPGEYEKGLTRPAIRVEQATPRDKLERESRLNYAKVYTVEYNVKVCFIGKVHQGSRSQVVADYNDIHPQLSYGGSLQAPEFSAQDVSQTGGWLTSDSVAEGLRGFEASPPNQNSGYGEQATVIYPATQEHPDRHTDAIDEVEEETALPVSPVSPEVELDNLDFPETETSYQHQTQGGEEVDVYPAEVDLYPAEPDLHPAEPDLYPAEPDLYPEEANLYPAEPDLYPGGPNPYPTEPVLYPEEPDLYSA